MIRGALAVGAALLLAAGCGGGGGSLSKGDYAKKADAICAKYNRKINALGSPKSLADIGPFADKALALERKGNQELRDLKPPKDEEQTAKRWTAQNDKVADAVADLSAAAKKNNRAGIQAALRRGQAANKQANALAKQLGAQVCGRG
jgi:hypothetical protein